MNVAGRLFFRMVLRVFITVALITGYALSDDYSQWQYSRTFLINTGADGANVTGDVINFPLLLRLTPETFQDFSQTSSGGSDIRFAKADGSHLPYQIERWVDNAGNADTAEIWVYIDTVFGNTAGQEIRMYWGNAGAADSSTGVQVFRNAEGFMATYHFGNLTDATGNGYNAADLGDSATVSASGIIGQARRFGGNSFLQPGDLPDRAVGTITFWFCPSTTFNGNSATTQGIWGKTDDGSYNSNISLRGADYVTGGSGTTGQMQIKVENNNSGYYINSTTGTFTAGLWYHVAWSWDGSTSKLFINGVMEASQSSSQTVSATSSDEIGRAWYDGQNITDGNPRYFTGNLDEFRFSSVARSENWIRLCYENQKTGQTMISFPVTGEPPVIVSEPEDITVAVGTDTSLAITAEGEGTLSYKWLRYPSDSVGNETTLAFSPVRLTDTASAFRCIVENAFGADSSRWIALNVIDTPRIIIQPVGRATVPGGTAAFSLNVKDTAQITYAWYKLGGSTVLSTTRSYTIDAVVPADTGNYYCILSNPAAVVSSDTIACTIIPPDPDKPLARFAVSPKTGVVPLAVGFTDESEGVITSRRWSFGDASFDTIMNPTHVYTKAGSFTVTLVVIGPGGSDTLTKIDSVTIESASIPVQNSIVIDTAYYDLYSGDIKVFWHIDPSVLDKNPQVGIGTGFSPGNPTPVTTDTLTMPSQYGSTVITSNRIIPDTTCYIFLWLRLQGGVWLSPTFESTVSVRTGANPFETVTYFNPEVTLDTVDAYHGNVSLWKDGEYTVSEPVTDTLESLTLSRIPRGLLPVGMPMRFLSADSTDPFFVGIHIDSLPEGYSAGQVRMYRIHDDVFHVVHETATDTARRIAYVKTGNLNYPFIPMVDTIPPSIKMYLSTPLPIIDSLVYHQDSLGIIDNSANVRWSYSYGSGNRRPSTKFQGLTADTAERFSIAISDTLPESDLVSGFRILIVADDGCNRDTLQFFRNVLLSVPESLTTVKGTWNPLYASTILHHPEAESLVTRLCRLNNVDKYTKRRFRLFRWHDYAGNENNGDKWIEYSPADSSIRSLFRLDPGTMIWLKTSAALTVSLGTGAPLSLTDTLTVELPPKQWTDFGMPYQFDIRIEEILSATGENGDSLMVFRWTQDKPDGVYSLEPLYVKGMPDRQDKTAEIRSSLKSGYSFYNLHSKTIRLRIPPIPSFMANLSKKRSDGTSEPVPDDAWSAKFISRTRDSGNETSVYFGYAPHRSEQLFPQVPTFSPLRLAVTDRKTGGLFGHSISTDARDGLVKEMQITNSSDSTEELTYHLEKAGAFPGTFKAYCYDNAAGELTENGTIVVAAGASVSRWVVVGDASRIRQFIDKSTTGRFQLHSLYPNPFRSAVSIRYSVPFGAEERVGVAIYTMQGRKVWEHTAGKRLSEGEHVITWNGRSRNGAPVSSGLYIVQLTISGDNGNVIGTFRRRVTLLR